MTIYSLSIFESRNTAHVENIEARSFVSAKKIARLKSQSNPFPVVVCAAGNCNKAVKYDHGVEVEWEEWNQH